MKYCQSRLAQSTAGEPGDSPADLKARIQALGSEFNELFADKPAESNKAEVKRLEDRLETTRKNIADAVLNDKNNIHDKKKIILQILYIRPSISIVVLPMLKSRRIPQSLASISEA